VIAERPAASAVAILMGELAVSDDVAVPLAIYGLGSCIGLSLWDPARRVAAMAHFMLPAGTADQPPAKFVDAGLGRLISAFELAGGRVAGAQIKAAGGAAVLALSGGMADIGRRNADALRIGLAERRLRLTASDLGGRMARTIELSTETGGLSVRAAASVVVI